jgi:glycine dehydrogenase subunit 1
VGVYIENPNFFGIFEEHVLELKSMIKDVPLVVGINPISLGIIKPPGDYGADIVIGEGQPLGNPMNFGGPLLGIFACTKQHVRKMPGRIVGLTKDTKGRRAFCLTLQTREQHIRRKRATSNICTNEALCAIAAATYIALIGKRGLQKLAALNLRNAHYLAAQINKSDNFRLAFKGKFFNEFVIVGSNNVSDFTDLHEYLLGNNIHGGLLLKPHFPELGDTMLITVTEVHDDEILDKFVELLNAWSSKRA